MFCTVPILVLLVPLVDKYCSRMFASIFDRLDAILDSNGRGVLACALELRFLVVACLEVAVPGGFPRAEVAVPGGFRRVDGTGTLRRLCVVFLDFVDFDCFLLCFLLFFILT